MRGLIACLFGVALAGAAQAQTTPQRMNAPLIMYGFLSHNVTPGGFAEVCPAANCPVPGITGNRVRSGSFLNGETALDADTAEWLGVDSFYVNTGRPHGQKVARYIGLVQGPNAGAGWTLNTDIVRNGVPGVSHDAGFIGTPARGTPGAMDPASGTVGYELDFSNFDVDSGVSEGAFTVGMYLHNRSTHKSLAGIFMSNLQLLKLDGSGVAAWEHGILMQGPTLINGSAFYDTTNSSVSFKSEGTHAGAAFYANDTSPYGLEVSGDHSTSSVFLTDNAPRGVQIAGTRSVAAIRDASVAPVGVSLIGTYSQAINTSTSTANIALATKAGQKVCFAGITACAYYDTAAHKWYFSDENNVVVFSVAMTSGNAIFKGTVTPSATP